MWEIDNSTSYAAARNWIRDKEGAHRWLVAVKATFDIGEQGALFLAEEQSPPQLEPIYRGDPGTTSLRWDSDLLAEKTGTEILLDASAYAPGGQPTEIVEVSLRAASVSKTLLVYGPRVYRGGSGAATSSSEPFTRHPIQYEWAYGGSDLAHPDLDKRRMDDRNPVGRGVAADPQELRGQAAHVIEYPGREATKAGPAGFGPIASFWSPRRERSGTYDDRWEQTKKPRLPDDYDPLHAMCAPDDQQCGQYLRGGEPFLITNMTPEGRLQFNLPRVALTLHTYFRGSVKEQAARLTTVLVAPDTKKLFMVWQSALTVPSHDAEYLDFTTIADQADLA